MQSQIARSAEQLGVLGTLASGVLGIWSDSRPLRDLSVIAIFVLVPVGCSVPWSVATSAIAHTSRMPPFLEVSSRRSPRFTTQTMSVTSTMSWP